MVFDLRQSLRKDIVAVLGLFLFATIVAFQWATLQPAADDPELLNWARMNQQAASDWGPFYVLLLRRAYLASGDTLTGFRIVISGVSLISSILIFCWMRKCSGSFKWSAAIAAFYLVSGFSPAASSTHQSAFLIESSLAGHMALCFVLLALVAASPSFRSPVSLALCADFLLLATYCRPEFLLASTLCLVAALISVARHRAAPFDLAGTAVLAALWIGLIALWGLPLPSSHRAFVAFGQHAGLSFCAAYNSFCVTNLWPDWMSYVNKLFPGATSVWTAFEANPLAFGEHLARNVALFINNIGTAMLDFAGLPAPVSARRLVAACAVVWLATELFRKWLHADHVSRLPAARLNPATLVVAAVIVLPQLINCILLYPRVHYMIVPLTVGLGIMISAFPRAARSRRGQPEVPVS